MNEYARDHKYFALAKEFRRRICEFLDDTLPFIGHALTSRINNKFKFIISPTLVHFDW
ncbi:MAG: hypothetical protein KAH18_13300 [Psychromonas sp.]|nr:hypothetical protein [Psychromonas sp.]